MRIRKFLTNSASQSSPPSPASSSSPPSSSSSSSITTNLNSLASSIDSSSSAPSTSSPTSSSSITRCQGLDLLVKAIHQVTAGSAVGVPYIQRRVIRRRRRRSLSFDSLCIAEIFNRVDDRGKGSLKNVNFVAKRQRRGNAACSSKYQDSVLEPWTAKNRRPRSVKIGQEIGS